MRFQNDKKTFLEKLDKSKKGEVDEKVIPLVNIINNKEDYYTTSSCSGRAYLWSGTGKKNQTEWIKVSHDLIDEDFFEVDVKDKGELVWLRVEGFIMHIACRNLEATNRLLEIARRVFKKSCLLSASSKFIVEVRGSEFIEMPLYHDGKILFSGEVKWLQGIVNEKFRKIFAGIESFTQMLSA